MLTVRQITGWIGRIAALLLVLTGGAQPTLPYPTEAMQHGDYATALVSRPNDLAILDQWIAASVAAQRTEQAIALLRRAAALSGWTVRRRAQMADVLAAVDPAQAAAYRRTLLNGSAQDVPLLQFIVTTDLSVRDWGDARQMLQRLAALSPLDGSTLYRLALLRLPDDPNAALVDLGRAAASPAFHDRALVASQLLSASAVVGAVPNGGAALIPLSLRLINDTPFEQVDWPLVEYLLNRAAGLLSLDGTDRARVLALMGLTQDAQGRDGWPLIAQAQILTADPIVTYATALHLRLTGDLDGALAALAKAEASDPRNPALAVEIGTIYRLRSRWLDAATWFSLAIRLDPNNLGAWQLLSAFYADENYTLDGDGLVMIQQAVRVFPNDAELRASLGQALLETNQASAARAELETALKLDASNARARYYLAVTLEQQGDTANARDAYLYVAHNASVGDFSAMAGRALQRLGS